MLEPELVGGLIETSRYIVSGYLGSRANGEVVARDVVCPFNRKAYRRRNVIGRLFGRLKNWRRIATRCDRIAVNFIAAIALVATITQWLG